MQQTERFVKGAVILSIAGILAKIISVFFRIPLVQLVGDEGAGYYTTVYPIFSLLVAAGVVGIPGAISKMIAEDVAIGAFKRAQKTFRDALVLGILFGAFVSILLVVGAQGIIKISDSGEETKYIIWGLAFAPIFVCISGVIRGYFQGYQLMKTTAISQIIENFSKVLIGISLVYILMNREVGLAKAVSGAAIGASVGFVFSATYMMITYRVQRKQFHKELDADTSVLSGSFGQHTKQIVTLAIPFSIATAVLAIVGIIDSMTLYHQLAKVGYDDSSVRVIMGQLGNATSVINFPLTIGVALSISIIPAISEAMAKKNTSELNSKISQGCKLAVMFSLPAAVGIFMLARPVMNLLYPGSGGFVYLRLYSICLVFIIIGQTLAGILQGISKQNMPLLALIAAIIVKVVLNLLLTPTHLRAEGAVIASICYYGVYVGVNYLILKKYVCFKLDKLGIFLKPLLGTGVMLITIYFTFPAMMHLTHNNPISTVFTVGVGVILYFLVLLFTKAFTREELSMLPKHVKIIRFLERKKLIQ